MARAARNLGDEYEEHLAKELGGELVPGSGSAKRKGDIRLGKFLIQAKRTNKRSFILKRADLGKAEKEAMNMGNIPAFIVGFYEEDRPVEQWVAVPLWFFKQI